MGTMTFSFAFVGLGADLKQIIDQIEPELRKLADPEKKPDPKHWSPKEIIGHLIDSATNNHQRFVRGAQQKGGIFPSYDQDFCVEFQQPNAVEWGVLLGLWADYNRYIAHVLSQMPPGAERYQVTVGDKPMTLLFVAQDYVEHLKHHLNQIVGKKYKTTYGA